MNYVMPTVDNSGIIDIKDGRHPVIEKIIGGSEFVPNDTYLDKKYPDKLLDTIFSNKKNVIDTAG